MRYLDGDQAPFKTIADRKKLVGKNVRYLRKGDIDRSGRGYFFPKSGYVVGAKGNNIEFECYNDVSKSDIVEIVIIEDKGDKK